MLDLRNRVSEDVIVCLAYSAVFFLEKKNIDLKMAINVFGIAIEDAKTFFVCYMDLQLPTL